AKRLAWRVVDVVVAAEVARVVVRDGKPAPVLGFPRNAMLGPEPLDVRRVVNNLVVPAELRKFVADLVEAMWAAGHDRLHAIAVERLDRVLGQHLIEVLVAHAARRIAVAMLLLAEDRETDLAGFE